MFSPRNVALAAVITLLAWAIIGVVFNLILCVTIGNNSDYCMSFMSDLTNGQFLLSKYVKVIATFLISGYVLAVVYNRLSLKSYHHKKENLKLYTKSFALANGIAAALYQIIKVIFDLIYGLITDDPWLRLVIGIHLRSGLTFAHIVMATIVFSLGGYIFAIAYNRLSLRS